MSKAARTPVCRLCGRYLAILGRPIRVTVPAVTVAPTALVGSLIRSSNLPHSLQRGVLLRCPGSKSNAVVEIQCNGSNMKRCYLKLMKYVNIRAVCKSLTTATETKCTVPMSIDRLPIRGEKRCTT